MFQPADFSTLWVGKKSEIDSDWKRAFLWNGELSFESCWSFKWFRKRWKEFLYGQTDRLIIVPPKVFSQIIWVKWRSATEVRSDSIWATRTSSRAAKRARAKASALPNRIWWIWDCWIKSPTLSTEPNLWKSRAGIMGASHRMTPKISCGTVV